MQSLQKKAQTPYYPAWTTKKRKGDRKGWRRRGKEEGHADRGKGHRVDGWVEKKTKKRKAEKRG